MDHLDFSEHAGLKQKTIYNHLSNADLFINEFLNYHMDATMEEGVTMLGDFLGGFFIRKCMWSTPATVKTTATSLKKFYKCMAEHGKIEKKDYDYVCRDIKESRFPILSTNP